MAKLIGTDPNQVPTNADLGTMAYQDKDNVHLTGRVVVSSVNPAPFTVPNASESLEINDGSTTKLLMYADNSNAYIQASKYDGTNPGRTLIFATKQGTDGISAEAARFNVNGNLAFPNGQGIDFSSSAGSGQTSSLLDDYEEGTFTPVWYDGFSSITYQLQTGVYVKVGRIVTIQLQLKASAATSTANGIVIGGLPFNASDSNSAYGGFFLNYNTFNTNSGDTYHKFASNNRIGIYRNIGGARGANTAGITPTGEVILSGQYYTD